MKTSVNNPTSPCALLLSALLITLTGCAEVTSYESQDTEDKLLGGQLTSVRPEIGRLSLNGSSCTATLIRPQVVISAAHCVGYRTRSGRWGNFIIQRDGKSFSYPIDGVYSFGDGLGERDITLIHLTKVVPNSVATPTKIAVTEPTQGDVTIFGYGCQNRRTRKGSGQKQLYTHSVTQRSNQLCPGDSGGPVVVGLDGPLFKINSGYYTSGRQGDLFGFPTRHYRELSAYATMMNREGLSGLQRFIRQGGIDQEGGEELIGGGATHEDQSPPTIEVLSPLNQSEHLEQSIIEVTAKITDDSEYIQADLVWDFNGNSYPCPHRSQYVACTQEGDLFKWSVQVGEGQRTFRVRALDITGKESVSESRTIYLADTFGSSPLDESPTPNPAPNPDMNTQEPAEAPRVEVISPTQQGPVSENSSVQIIADIQSDSALREVNLVWDYNQNRYPCPTQQRDADCEVNGSQYVWTVRVSAAGARPFHIEAIDQAGLRGYSASHQFDVVPEASADQTPPQIFMIEPSIDEIWQENSLVFISAQITDQSGVASALLRWDFNGNDYPCPHTSRYVNCTVAGDTYYWEVQVTEGIREFRVVAEDTAGNTAQSEDFLINLH